MQGARGFSSDPEAVLEARRVDRKEQYKKREIIY
jgi:hypothetical protein